MSDLVVSLKKKKVFIFISLFLIILSVVSIVFVNNSKKVEVSEPRLIKTIESVVYKDIESHYGERVKVIEDTIIYRKENDKLKEVGTIYKDNIIELGQAEYNIQSPYFALKDSDKYIYYTNVSVSDEVLVDNQRYKKYIPFNENIVTKDTYTIYHQDGSKFYTLSEKAEYPIIIKEDNAYYVEFNNELVYILKEDVEEIKENQNTDLIPVSSIPVLNYHFIYDPKVTECNQRICMTTDLFTEHVKYLKSNYFDLTMKEFELFMNNKIRLPESVLVTLDDGWLSSNAIKILEENEFHATYFLITLGYKENKSEYVEFHSHTHNMHKVGVCPGGQGGGIKCLSEKVIQDDLKKSREALNNTTYFCYPFYETNSYAIEQLKKAGFTLAFVGGNRRAKPSDNHYLIPRYRITNSMTVDKLKKTIEK